jgi:formate dehydrogenase beta subunit
MNDEKGSDAHPISSDWLKSNMKCQNVCALHEDVPGYVALIAKGKFQEAYELIRKTNPFPSICGRVCHHPCENHCWRAEIDAPVAIDALKRFVSDYALKEGLELKIRKRPSKNKKVGIIGAGPTGLTAAHDLARMGYEVTVFDSHTIPGGMLAVGIPNHRLPKQILNFEINHIRELGVEIKSNTTIGKDVSFEDSRSHFDAIFIATGAHKPVKLGIDGEDKYQPVLDCIDFLRRNNLGERVIPGKRTAVIGGGYAALDTARMAIRLGSETTIIHNRTRGDIMAVHGWEVEEAEREGVRIIDLASPLRITGSAGRVLGLACIKTELGDPEESGRQRPVSVKGSEFLIDTDCVIPAVDQTPDLSFLGKNHGFNVSTWGTLIVNEKTLATDQPGVFAGGDVVTGPNTVIEGIAHGRRAAVYVDKYLGGMDIERLGEDEIVMTTDEVDRIEMDRDYDRINRHPMPTLPLMRRMGVFDEVELGFTAEMAVREAKRCLRCNHKICIESTECIACGRCSEVCPYGCIQMVTLEGEEDHFFKPWLKGEVRVKDDTLCIRCGLCKEICPVDSVIYKRVKWSKESDEVKE